MIPVQLQTSAWIFKALVVVGLVLAVWFHGRGEGKEAGKIEVAQLKAKHAQVLAGIAQKTAKAHEAVLTRERVISHDLADADRIYRERLDDVEQNTRDAVLADVRAGRIGLRYSPSRCAVPATAQATPATGIGDGAAQGGEADAVIAADAIAIAAEADAQLIACQAVIEAYTKVSE